MDRELEVQAAAVTVLRLYDLAYAIDLERVESLGAVQTPAVARLRFTRAEPKAITFGVSPVEIGLGPVQLPPDPRAGAPVGADPPAMPRASRRIEVGSAHARVYDFGVVSIALRFPLAGIPWSELVERVIGLDRASTATPLWSQLLGRVRELIAPAVDRPSDVDIEEEYFVVTLQRLDRPVTAEELLRTVDVAPLLSGETQALSDGARADLLRHRFSYYPTDLAILTWDHAVLLEPAGDRDVADVLEVANAQLLELRYYDELLNAELPRMYDRVEATRRGSFTALARRRFADLARSLYTLVAEVTETTERVDNALKVTEDVYLARIYGAALDLFRVATWGASVQRKLAIIRDTYTALYDEAATARAELLELAIVLLIVIELVVALIR